MHPYNKYRSLYKKLTLMCIFRRQPNKIAMIHIGRCGSTVLSSQLSQNNDIFWDGEVFSKLFRTQGDKNQEDIEKVRFSIDPKNILEQRIARVRQKFYGFEIKPFHCRLMNYSISQFVDCLDLLGFKYFVVLDRKNRLRKIVSSIIARKTDIKHYKHGEKAILNRIYLDPYNVEIDWDKKPLIDYLTDYDMKFNDLENHLKGKRVLSLNYEDDIRSDPQKAYKLICEYIGVNSQEVKINLSVTNPYPLDEIILNYKEVEEYLTGSGYEWMLDSY